MTIKQTLAKTITAMTATLAVAALASTSAQAAAGDDAHVVTDSTVVNANRAVGLAVRCPDGERALSGGAEFTGGPIALSGPLDASGMTEQTESGDIPVFWYTAVLNQSADRQTVKFYAVCSASSDATLMSESFFLGAAQTGRRAVGCPAGQRVVGGGLGTTGSINSDLVTSKPGPAAIADPQGMNRLSADGDVAQAWYVAAHTYDLGQTYKAFALCSPTSRATVEATTSGIANDDSSVMTATCPSGQRVLSGGFGSGSYELPTTNVTRPSSGGPAVDWTVNVKAPHTFGDRTISEYGVFAICEGRTPAPAPAAPAAPDATQQPAVTPQETVAAPETEVTAPTPVSNPLCAETEATIVGTDASETITGTDGDDVIYAMGGNDKVLASGGNDVVCGGAGKDTLKGQAGFDLLMGEAGKDRLAGGTGRDACYGAAGKDRATTCERGKA